MRSMGVETEVENITHSDVYMPLFVLSKNTHNAFVFQCLNLENTHICIGSIFFAVCANQNSDNNYWYFISVKWLDSIVRWILYIFIICFEVHIDLNRIRAFP